MADLLTLSEIATMSAPRELNHPDDFVILTVDVADSPIAEVRLSEIYNVETSTMNNDYLLIFQAYIDLQLENTHELSNQSRSRLLVSRFIPLHCRENGDLLSLRKPALERLIQQTIRSRVDAFNPISVSIRIQFKTPGWCIPKHAHGSPQSHPNILVLGGIRKIGSCTTTVTSRLSGEVKSTTSDSDGTCNLASMGNIATSVVGFAPQDYNESATGASESSWSCDLHCTGRLITTVAALTPDPSGSYSFANAKLGIQVFMATGNRCDDACLYGRTTVGDDVSPLLVSPIEREHDVSDGHNSDAITTAYGAALEPEIAHKACKDEAVIPVDVCERDTSSVKTAILVKAPHAMLRGCRRVVGDNEADTRPARHPNSSATKMLNVAWWDDVLCKSEGLAVHTSATVSQQAVERTPLLSNVSTGWSSYTTLLASRARFRNDEGVSEIEVASSSDSLVGTAHDYLAVADDDLLVSKCRMFPTVVVMKRISSHVYVGDSTATPNSDTQTCDMSTGIASSISGLAPDYASIRVFDPTPAIDLTDRRDICVALQPTFLATVDEGTIQLTSFPPHIIEFLWSVVVNPYHQPCTEVFAISDRNALLLDGANHQHIYGVTARYRPIDRGRYKVVVSSESALCFLCSALDAETTFGCIRPSSPVHDAALLHVDTLPCSAGRCCTAWFQPSISNFGTVPSYRFVATHVDSCAFLSHSQSTAFFFELFYTFVDSNHATNVLILMITTTDLNPTHGSLELAPGTRAHHASPSVSDEDGTIPLCSCHVHPRLYDALTFAAPAPTRLCGSWIHGNDGTSLFDASTENHPFYFITCFDEGMDYLSCVPALRLASNCNHQNKNETLSIGSSAAVPEKESWRGGISHHNKLYPAINCNVHIRMMRMMYKPIDRGRGHHLCQNIDLGRSYQHHGHAS